MSSIDERIVGMRFDNAQFEKGVKQSSDSLAKLKANLNFGNLSKGLNQLSEQTSRFNLSGIGENVNYVASRFSAMAVVGITALAGIASAAVTAGLQLVQSLAVQPISEGMDDYNRKLTSVQTVMNATGRSLEDVGTFFDQLDDYADRTIYKLSDMTTALSKFTNAGVELETAIPAIKGISNMVALAGQDAGSASIAYYNLAQSISNGFLTRMDFKSLELANVATVEFKNYMVDAAVAAGTLTKTADGMFKIVGQGSGQAYTSAQLFIDGLQEGWANRDILLGVFEDYGDITTEIGKKAFAAAQDVKSFPMMMDTLRASVGTGWTETFENLLGNLTESKSLFTGMTLEIQNIIDYMAEMRNVPLGDWKELGGRKVLLDALAYSWEQLKKIVLPIRSAMESIFPPITGERLVSLTNAVARFLRGLYVTADTMKNIKRTAAGLFAVLDIGWMIIKAVATAIFELLGATTAGTGGVLDFTAKIGDFLVAVRNAIKEGNIFGKVFTFLKEVLLVPIGIIKSLISLIATLVLGMGSITKTGVEGFFNTLQARMTPLEGIGKAMTFVWQKLGDAINWLQAKFKELQPMMEGALAQVGTFIGDIFKGTDFNTALDALNVGLFGALVFGVRSFLNGFMGLLEGGLKQDRLQGIVDSIKGVFGQLQSTLKTFQDSIKAKTLVTIATAVALLTASALALSLVDSAKLAGSLAAMSVMFGQLIGMMAAMDALGGKGGFATLPKAAAALIVFGVALQFFVAALIRLSALSWEELLKGTTALTFILGALVAASHLMSQNVKRTIIAAGAITLLAVGMFTMSKAVKVFSSIPLDQMIVGLTAMAISLALVTGALLLLGLGGPMMLLGAGALLVVSVGLIALATALIIMSNLSWENVGIITVMLVSALGILAVAMIAMIPAGLGAASLVTVSLALVVLAGALMLLSLLSWENVGKVLVILVGTLGTLALGMMAMTGALPGAAALLVVAAALLILAPVLMILGNLSLDQIGIALLALAGIFLVLGVAGYALAPVVPVIMALGIALGLIGVAIALAGVGLLAFSLGITALAGAGAVGIQVMMMAITQFASLIPMLAQQIGKGFIAFLGVIVENGQAILDAVKTMLLSIIAALVEVIPPLVEAIVLLVTTLVEALVVLIPMLVEAGLVIIGGILEGLANNMDKIVEEGVNIISALLDGLANALPRLSESAANLIITFIEVLASTIEDKAKDFNDATGKLVKAIADGVAGAIESNAKAIRRAGERIGQALLNGAKSILGIASPSKAFYEYGEFSTMGLVGGALSLVKNVVTAGKTLGGAALSGVKSAMARISDAISGDIDMTPVIRPVVDLTDVQKGATHMASMLGSPKLNVESGYSAASSIATEQQTQRDIRAEYEANSVIQAGDTTVVEFNQTINSPKAISQAEVYRNTNNIISKSRKELEDASKGRSSN